MLPKLTWRALDAVRYTVEIRTMRALPQLYNEQGLTTRHSNQRSQLRSSWERDSRYAYWDVGVVLDAVVLIPRPSVLSFCDDDV